MPILACSFELQSERQGGSGTFAAFLVETIQTRLDTSSVRGVLAGALLASIGVGLVVYSILGNDDLHRSACSMPS